MAAILKKLNEARDRWAEERKAFIQNAFSEGKEVHFFIKSELTRKVEVHKKASEWKLNEEGDLIGEVIIGKTNAIAWDLGYILEVRDKSMEAS